MLPKWFQWCARELSCCLGCESVAKAQAPACAEIGFNAGKHEISDHLAGNARGNCSPAMISRSQIPMANDAYYFAVPAADLQTVRRPALVEDRCDYLTLMGADGSVADIQGEQQIALAHEAEHQLVVDGRGACCPVCVVEQCDDPNVAVGGPCIHQLPDDGQ